MNPLAECFDFKTTVIHILWFTH